jgi:hypothetical protein
MVIMFEVKVLDTQGALGVSKQKTTSPFAGVYIKDGELVPVLEPFTFH